MSHSLPCRPKTQFAFSFFSPPPGVLEGKHVSHIIYAPECSAQTLLKKIFFSVSLGNRRGCRKGCEEVMKLLILPPSILLLLPFRVDSVALCPRGGWVATGLLPTLYTPPPSSKMTQWLSSFSTVREFKREGGKENFSPSLLPCIRGQRKGDKIDLSGVRPSPPPPFFPSPRLHLNN